MKSKKSDLLKIFLAMCVLLTSSCEGAASSRANASSPETILVGSTPGDAAIKSLLAISPDKPIDFIRWDLTLNQAENEAKTYVLNISFGAGEPNTPGFKGGGEKASFEGVYTISANGQAEIYRLKNAKAQTEISLVKLNENLFHFLMPDDKLMVGNGGWSYTLSRRDSSSNSAPVSFSRTNNLSGETAEQIIFDGRTPCREFARHFDLKVGNECFKLKWKLTLSRDPVTGEPTTYALQTTLNRPQITTGKWAVTRGLQANAEAIIYRLDPDKPGGGSGGSGESLSFLVGDENVLFFLDRENRLFTGNGDFSFTLNRRR